MAYIRTYFCAQTIFKVPSSNAFPRSQKIDLKKILVLDVPKGVKLPKIICRACSFSEYFLTVNPVCLRLANVILVCRSYRD